MATVPFNPYRAQLRQRVEGLFSQYGDPSQAYDALRQSVVPAYTPEEMREQFAAGKIPFFVGQVPFEEQTFTPTDTTGMTGAIDRSVQAQQAAANQGQLAGMENLDQARLNLLGQLLSEGVKALAPSSAPSNLPGAQQQFLQARQANIAAAREAERQRLLARGQGDLQREQLLFNTQVADRARQQQIDQFNSRGRMDQFIQNIGANQEYAKGLLDIMGKEQSQRARMGEYALELMNTLEGQDASLWDRLYLEDTRAANEQEKLKLKAQLEGGSAGLPAGYLGSRTAGIDALVQGIGDKQTQLEAAKLAEKQAKEAEGFWGVPLSEDEDEKITRLARENREQIELSLRNDLNALWDMRQSLDENLGSDARKLSPADPLFKQKVQAFNEYRSLLESTPEPDADMKDIEAWMTRAKDLRSRFAQQPAQAVEELVDEKDVEEAISQGFSEPVARAIAKDKAMERFESQKAAASDATAAPTMQAGMLPASDPEVDQEIENLFDDIDDFNTEADALLGDL